MVDHLVYGVPELAPAVARLEALLGVAPVPGGSHEGRGTHNALLALGGEAYLEVIAPDPAQPEPPSPRPFGLNDLTAPRLITFAVHAAPRAPDAPRTSAAQRLEQWRRQAAARGYDPGPVAAGGRRRPDGGLLRWHLCQRRELPFAGVVPFLIDWGTEVSPAAGAPPGCRLLRLEARHPQPPEVGAALRALGVELPVRPGPAPALRATLASPRGEAVLT